MDDSLDASGIPRVFHGVLPGFVEVYRVSSDSTVFSWFLPSIIEFDLVLLGFTEFYRVVLHSTGTLPSFIEFSRLFSSFYRIITDSIKFYLVLLGFTEYYRV